MEIERKWLVEGWPEGLPLLFEQVMHQGYISTEPTVRIRSEQMLGEEPRFILCFKSKGLLSRKEIEMEISRDQFLELSDLIGKPLIPKVRRTYQTADGRKLEVSIVDEGADTAFWYAEVEYGTEAEALAWSAEEAGLGEYLSNEVTGVPGQSMGAYWLANR